MAKPRRTSQELLEAIMHEVRRHPEWNDILSVRSPSGLRQTCTIPTGMPRCTVLAFPGGRI
jgi:hypothetical protein